MSSVPEPAYKLYGALGGGSAIVEGMLTRAGLPFTVTDLDWEAIYATGPEVAAVNPAGQIPALALPDGRTMAETVAIALYLSEVAPDAGLAPPVGDPLRPVFLRWLVTLSAAIYPMYTFGDRPERWVGAGDAAATLKANTIARTVELWRIIETELAPGQWMLGERWSALDIFVALMTRWRPGREKIGAAAPRTVAVAVRVEAMPDLAPVFKRHYPDG